MKKKFSIAIFSFALILGANSTSFAYEEPFMLDGPGMVKVLDQSERFAYKVLDLVNRERESRGIAPLDMSTVLNDAAVTRASEISEVFSHTRPDGSSCFSVVRERYRNIGENIAAGHSTPEETVEQWMNSPGHRANILDPDFTQLGVGYFYDEDSQYKHYWVQLFIRPMN